MGNLGIWTASEGTWVRYWFCFNTNRICLITLATYAEATVHAGTKARNLEILDTGWPRSGWPQVGHFDQKIKVNQIASYCAMLYPRCCSLWPCTFLGLHSSAFDSSAGQTRGSHFNFYWGTDTTMWSCVHVLCPCVTKIDFYQQLWNWQVKRLIKQHKKEIKMCLFVFENKFEHVTSNTQFRLAQIRAATSLHIMLQVCHRGKSSHKSSVSLWNDSI